MSKILIAALLALAACSGDELGARPDPSGSASPSKPPVVTLIANNVVLGDRDAGSVAFGVDAAGPAVSVIVHYEGDARIDVYAEPAGAGRGPGKPCPVAAGRRPDRSCVGAIADGVRETLEVDGEVARIRVVRASGTRTVNLRFEYDEGSREVSMSLPSLAPPPGASACKDNGCNPYLEMMPVRGGAFTARATFTGGPALLQLLSGRVIARSFSATGVPYRIPAERRGTSPLSISTRLDAPAEYALAILNENSSTPLTRIELTARWP